MWLNESRCGWASLTVRLPVGPPGHRANSWECSRRAEIRDCLMRRSAGGDQAGFRLSFADPLSLAAATISSDSSDASAQVSQTAT